MMSHHKDRGQFGKVAVLYGGTSTEREISLITGQAVWEALVRCDVDAHLVDTKQGFLTRMQTDNFKTAWIALHGSDGEDGKIQSFLESMNIRFTGSGSLSCSLTMNKLFTKKILSNNGFKTPDFLQVTNSDDYEKIVKKIKLPFVLKPCSQGSSIGVHIIENRRNYEKKLKTLNDFNDWIIAESYITGPEYTAGFLDGETLPLVKIDAGQNEFYDYEAKYYSQETKYVCPSGLDIKLEDKVKNKCTDIFKLFDIKGWARTDFFINEDYEPIFLEINTVPGMTLHSLVPMAASAIGINFDQLCLRILETSIR